MNEVNFSDSDQINDALKNLLSNMLKEMMTMLNAECGSLFLLDSQHKELVLDSFYNAASLSIKGLRQRVGEGVSGKVVNLRKPVLVKDINTDIRFNTNGYRHYRTNSFISIPLFTSQGLLGIINLADKSTTEPFSEKDLEFAVTMSKYVCLTIDSFHKCLGLKEEKENLYKQKTILEKYASMGKLAAGIVHEVNNPLDGIIRYTNMLLSQAENESISREYLLEVKKGLGRIANITKSLLEFSFQAQSNSNKEKRYVDIHNLIEEALDVLSNKLGHDIKISKNYREHLPKVLDLGLLHVVTNLLKNSFEAMSDQGTLVISTGIKDSMLSITFQDTGVGVPDEIKEHIFEPFFTTKAADKGTGLGLAICNEIMHKYEGKIQVHSLLGQGSTFTVLVPIKYLENA